MCVNAATARVHLAEGGTVLVTVRTTVYSKRNVLSCRMYLVARAHLCCCKSSLKSFN